VAAAGQAAGTASATTARRGGRSSNGSGVTGASRLMAVLFLAPAMIVLGTLVVFPIGWTLVRSLFGRDGFQTFVGLDNYVDMFTRESTLRAITNNIIWVAVVPAVVTALGLIFAVLTERVKWGTAFKMLIFMPMAISFLAAGVTFQIVYDAEPDRGVANAIAVTIHDMIFEPSPYSGARVRDAEEVAGTDAAVTTVTDDGAIDTAQPVSAGEPVLFPLVGIAPDEIPSEAQQAPSNVDGEGLHGLVWSDFVRGGGGTTAVVDNGERGLPGVEVEAIRDGEVVATTETDNEGRFSFPDLTDGAYTVRLAASNFAEPFNGVTWLGPTLVTPSIIISYIWIWAGFAMVLIAAGLSAIPRDALEAARVDGATEWQVFRRVTIPLVKPVLLVVIITMMINVLKVFDLVLVLAPQSTQSDATVVALEMWRVSFDERNQGLGSALAIFLFLLVLPAMLFNIRRFRRDQS